MITEEIIPVTLKKFTTTDGTVFTSEGPNENQITHAKFLAESHEERYDFLHFKVDESLLKEYKSENYNHFKWYFARSRAFCKKSWSNGTICEPVNFSNNFYNNVPEEDFLFLIRKCVLTPIDGRGVTFFDNCFSDEEITNIIFFSGIIDFSDLKEESYILFNKLLHELNFDLLEKLVNNGVITITLDNIVRAGHFFSYNRHRVLESKYKLKGTLTKAKKDNSRNSDYEEFAFQSTDESESFFKMCLNLCKIEREKVLQRIIYNSNFELFSTSNYGMLSLFYQHYDKMTEDKSFKKAEEIQSAVLLNVMRNGTKMYDYLTKYAKIDKELTLIIKNKENDK